MQSDGKILAGGGFTNIGGGSARLHRSPQQRRRSRRRVDPGADFRVYALTMQSNAKSWSAGRSPILTARRATASPA